MPNTLLPLERLARLNVRTIDREHETILRCVNALHAGLRCGTQHGAVNDLVGKLIRATQDHFETEEALMREHGYPHYIPHRSEHERLIEHIVDLERQIKSGRFELSDAITLGIKNWATIHIEISDRPLAKFLKSRGVS